MRLKQILMGTTILVGATAMTAASVGAAEVKPNGALDITIGGFLNTYYAIGDLEGRTGTDSRGSYDQRNDTEFHVTARGTDEATGLKYGATIEFEADTGNSDNTDETYAFISGAFGEFRMGDDDGAYGNGQVGGDDAAVFSGGIDGVFIDDYRVVAGGFDSSDATKVIYNSPVLAGFQISGSFTPHVNNVNAGQAIGTTDSGSFDDIFEGAIAYNGGFGDLTFKASIIGLYGDYNDSDPGGDDGDFEDSTKLIFGGFLASYAGFGFGAGIGTAEYGFQEYDWFNVGVNTKFGPAAVSLTYGQVFDGENKAGNDKNEEPFDLVLGVEVSVAPGLAVGGELAYFDGSLNSDDFDVNGNREKVNNDGGIVGLTGIKVSF